MNRFNVELFSLSKMFNYNLLVPLFLIISILNINIVFSYECYVCENQEDNNEKCIKTVKTCNVDDNMCMSIVRWGSTPFWDPTGQKQYYISKRCSTMAQCNEARLNNSRRCDRIWYNDWECVECCTGDRCNYFITLGTSSISANIILTALSLLSTILYFTFQF